VAGYGLSGTPTPKFTRRSKFSALGGAGFRFPIARAKDSCSRRNNRPSVASMKRSHRGSGLAILLCAYPNSNFELFEPAAHRRVMHSQMFGDRLQLIALSVVEKSFRSNVAAAGQLEDRSRISTDLKNFLPRFLVLRKLSHVIDGQHVGRRRPDFFQSFHFGMSRSFTRLSINLLSFFTDGPANPE